MERKQMKSAEVINETLGKVVKTGLSYAEAYRLAEVWTKNSPNRHRYIANEPVPTGNAPFNRIDGWQ